MALAELLHSRHTLSHPPLSAPTSTSPPFFLQEDRGDELYHALGVVEGHEGEASLRVRFRLTNEAQAGNERGLQRWVSRRPPPGQGWADGSGKAAACLLLSRAALHATRAPCHFLHCPLPPTHTRPVLAARDPCATRWPGRAASGTS